MGKRIQVTYLVIVCLQALHSTEEFAFKFYEVFPPARFINQQFPGLARPGFVVINLLLLSFGLVGFFYWVRPGREGARTVLWIWIGIEIFNAIAHPIWALLSGGYRPGLITAPLFVPVASYLIYLLCRAPRYGGAAPNTG